MKNLILAISIIFLGIISLIVFSVDRDSPAQEIQDLYKAKQAASLDITLNEFEILDTTIRKYWYAKIPLLRNTEFDIRYERVETRIEDVPQEALIVDAFATFRTPPVVIRAYFYKRQAYIISEKVLRGDD